MKPMSRRTLAEIVVQADSGPALTEGDGPIVVTAELVDALEAARVRGEWVAPAVCDEPF